MDFHEKDAHSSDEHEPAPLPLVRLNHVSFQCESVEASVGFYQRTLGFELVKRPAWLHKYGMGIHLLQRGSDSSAPAAAARPPAINPKGNHISFQCTDMGLMKARLGDMGLEFVAARVRDGETVVEQLFFHDPDGNVIEVCDCEKLPVIPLDDAGGAGLPSLLLPVETNVHG
ncbi:glyoxylase I 4-like [Miscanthus floridulus]|uniref:glyoxylase I 4-like n=1 Tax=Miscanthus floridulus TaxID=154761 RepID=UPI003457CD68